MHTPAEVVEGPVQARNQSGLRVKGTWYNVSKFRPLNAELPPVGAVVRLAFDSKGFMTDVEDLSAIRETSGRETSPMDVRLAVLQAAADFLARAGQTRQDVKSSHVIPLAERWLAWVLEQPEAES